MSFSDNGNLQPISRVTLFLDESNSITAGDDTGREISANCPHATQKMVNALLRKFRGSTYRSYEAIESNLDPSAELGDGATVCGVYGAIARMSDNGSGYFTISAPGKEDLEDEFPMEGPLSKMVGKQIRKVGSSLTKTAEEIRAEVNKLEESVGKTLESYAKLSITDEIKASVTGIEKTVNGYTDADGNEVPGVVSTVSDLSVGLDGFKVDVEKSIGTDTEGKLQTVSSKIEAEFGKITLEASNGETTSTIKLKYGSTEIESAEIKFTGFVTFGGLSGGTTTVDGACIKTGKVSAEHVDADGLKVKAANITGELTIGQLGSSLNGYAKSTEIPTKVGQLANDSNYQTETGVTTIIDGTVTTDFVNALGITAKSVSASNVTAGTLNAGDVSLAGAMYVYDIESGYIGGYLGYDDGFNSTTGIGIRSNANGLGPQMVCTEQAARLSYSLKAGTYVYQNGVTCQEGSLVIDAASLIQWRFGIPLAVKYNMEADSFYPAGSAATLGTETLPWSDVFAAGTSMSDLLSRVEALEAK